MIPFLAMIITITVGLIAGIFYRIFYTDEESDMGFFILASYALSAYGYAVIVIASLIDKIRLKQRKNNL